jgi:hypothetical protein
MRTFAGIVSRAAAAGAGGPEGFVDSLRVAVYNVVSSPQEYAFINFAPDRRHAPRAAGQWQALPVSQPGGGEEVPIMEDVVNRLARELADAIAAAVSEDPRIEACREKARAAGYEMKVSLEAVVGFATRPASNALAKVGVPVKTVHQRRPLEMSANDRRFLRSLRIAADEKTPQEEVE